MVWYLDIAICNSYHGIICGEHYHHSSADEIKFAANKPRTDEIRFRRTFHI